jgi:hypothetical protein
MNKYVKRSTRIDTKKGNMKKKDTNQWREHNSFSFELLIQAYHLQGFRDKEISVLLTKRNGLRNIP